MLDQTRPEVGIGKFLIGGEHRCAGCGGTIGTIGHQPYPLLNLSLGMAMVAYALLRDPHA